MAQVEVLNIDTKLAQSSIKQLRQELKRLQDQMAGLEEGSEEFLKVAASAGQVKHQLDEIRNSVNGASADFGDMLSASTTALNGIVGGLTAAQGAMNLFGIESEATVEAMKKLQALMAIGQGIAHIDNGIKAFNKLKKAIETTTLYQKLFGKQTLISASNINKQTASTNAATASTNKFKVALQQAAVSAKAFGNALSTAFKGAVVLAAIALIIKGIGQLIDRFRVLTDESSKFNATITNIQESWTALESRFSEFEATSKVYDTFNTLRHSLNSVTLEMQKFFRTYDETLSEQYSLVDDEVVDYWNNLSTATKQYSATVHTAFESVKALSEENVHQWENAERIRTLFNTLTEGEAKLADVAILLKQEGAVTNEISTNLWESVNFVKNALKQLDDEIANSEKTIRGYERSIKKGETEGATKSLLTELQRRKALQEEVLIGLKNTKAQYIKVTEAAATYYTKFAEGALEQANIAREQRKNEAEVFKAQIDAIAARSEAYKNSLKYVEDQIKYWKMLLPLEQKGSAAYEKIAQTILTLMHQMTPELETVVNGISDILDPDTVKIVAATDTMVSKFVAIKASIVDVNNQFGILIDTVGRFSESSLGLSSNWTQALADVQTAVVSFMNDAAVSADATAEMWTKSAALGLQAVGTILNSVSNEIDVNSEESFKSQQNLQVAASTINGAAGIVNAWVSAMSPVNAYLGMPAQITLGSVTSAAIAALTGVQIAQILKQKYNGSSSGLNSSSVNATIVPPTQYTQAVQNANIESQLRDTRVYVVESDIQQTGHRVSVQESENTY